MYHQHKVHFVTHLYRTVVIMCCCAALPPVTCKSMVRSKRRVHPLALLLPQPITVSRRGGDGSSIETPISGSSQGRCNGVVVEVEGAQFAGEVKTWVMRVRVGNTFSHSCQHIILFDCRSDLIRLIIVVWLNSVDIVWFD